MFSTIANAFVTCRLAALRSLKPSPMPSPSGAWMPSGLVRPPRARVSGVGVGVGAVLALAAAPASAQVFLNLDGSGIGTGSCTARSPGGIASDSVNINNLFFPQFGTRAASIVTDLGTGYASIATSSEFDSGFIRLQSVILAQGSSICEPGPNGGCGNGTGTAGATTRATFRVSEEAVLFLGGIIYAASHVDPGIGGSGNSSSTSSVVVAQGPTTLFGRTIRNSTGSFSTETIAEGGVARLFPGLDYAFTVASSGDGQSFGRYSSADGNAGTLVTVRLFPPVCPTATAPADVAFCARQAGSPATFTVIASGALPRTVRWQRSTLAGWFDLTDGPVAGVGTVSGSSTTSLTISGQGNFTNSFRAVVHNNCGDAFSAPALLSVCAADFNCDGFIDFFDYNDYVDCFETGNCGGGSADFNSDGFVDFFDYTDFVVAFEAGC